MPSNRHVARDISYSYSASTRGGRAMIRLMENTTGRLRLINRADGYEYDVAAGRDFWAVMVERYGLTLDVTGGSLDNIPTEGPLILIANHPYGILDGLMMGHILARTRGDFRILAHRIFRKAEDLNRIILPISVPMLTSDTLINFWPARATANAGASIGSTSSAMRTPPASPMRLMSNPNTGVAPLRCRPTRRA